jgi:hypothetical protein
MGWSEFTIAIGVPDNKKSIGIHLNCNRGFHAGYPWPGNADDLDRDHFN